MRRLQRAVGTAASPPQLLLLAASILSAILLHGDSLNEGAATDGDGSGSSSSSSSSSSSTSPLGDAARWQAVIDRCVPAIVSLRTNATRSFDTTSPGASQATGFVVDAEQGLILTNRHVVHPGPIVADALFQNHEEVPLTAVYRDPIHDFGLFRFDPKHLKHLKHLNYTFLGK